MNFEQTKKYGLFIDTIAAIPIAKGILMLISWSENLLLLTYSAEILLPISFVLIEKYAGPVIVKIIYHTEFKKGRKELKANIEIYTKNPFPITAGE